MKNRTTLMKLFATMDDEAFAWLVLACLPSAMVQGTRTQIWPDGVGGFQDRKTIEAIRKAARKWTIQP